MVPDPPEGNSNQRDCRPRNTVSVAVRCPACGRRIRWRGRGSARVDCPHCHTQLVFLRSAHGRYRVCRMDEGALAELVCGWLGRRTDDDDERPEENPSASDHGGDDSAAPPRAA